MIKVYFHFKRKSGMSVEEFLRHWREVHVPATKKVSTVRKYVFCVPLASQYEHAEPLWDGIGETWWDTEEDFGAFVGSPQGQEILGDLPNFTDQSYPPVFCKEEVIIG